MREKPGTVKHDPLAVGGLVPRFYLGIVFAVAAYTKLRAPLGYVEYVRGFLGTAAGRAPDWYASFIATSVGPHLASYATAVVGAEVFVAISLLFGFVTRVGASVAIFLLINYMFAKGSAIWSPASNDGADIVLAFVVLMSGPGRIFGIDRLFAR